MLFQNSVLALALTFASTLNAGVAFTPLNIKEGLWEMKMNMSLEGMKMPQMPPELLAKMPAAQREKMAHLMGASHEPTVIKECITKEKLAKYEAFNSKHKECTHKPIVTTASKYEATFTCDMKHGKTTGNMKVEAIDSEHSRGSVRSTSEHQGKTFAANMTFESTYLGPKCGDIK